MVYLQNLQDTFHFKNHAAPIHAGEIDTAASVTFVEGNWGKGHVAPNKSVESAVLEDVINRKVAFSSSHSWKPAVLGS